MAEYKAPLREMHFLLHEVFAADQLWARLPGLAGAVERETADAILEEMAKLAANTLDPLNRSGDEEGCHWVEGEVTTPAGMKEAYATYCEGGWGALLGNPEYGGMGMPKMLGAQVEEMINSASISFALYPMLTAGACLAIDTHASEALKQKYLPKMYEGTWAGVMDLTEPHAGTDLGMIRTKAEPQEDGSYRITGSKIFITGGDQDLSENIVHLVLAKLPDAPAGSRGISLFLVPKYLVNEDGSLGERNGVHCGSIEHKMGIKASATCAMNFDGAKGWLVGEVNKGLAAMFTMMNYERLGVGIQGLGASERSYQNAREYALERIQSRAPSGPQQPDKAADPIIVHPDVRRMLLTQKALIGAGRALSTYVAQWLDIAKFGEGEEKQHAEGMVALLTPVAKAFITDAGLECTVLGQQVFGGHGYIREWGQEQLVRDVRITQIYEGTNGIQALDLVGRKTVANGGAYFELFATDVQAFIDREGGREEMAEFVLPLSAGLQCLKEVTASLIARAKEDPNAPGAASVEYLHLFGYVAYAYMWARMAAKALPKAGEDDFYKGQVKTARFYFARLLPRTQSLAASVKAGSGTLMDIEAELF
ncbi:acyl-CoA dehydrogenase C-terminal domain-containing protein [Microbulbifer thermotolerans]|uniref:3-methylmercaptopropionyl-CoA dehydrogenase n=1 Tax=Microbulbifer thermotolerans TaxID=252514 RepID=A0A143HIY4_MICTH|nr:acyl-CoA dehydrogenase C-terminal domain-containing protein [Microbulbifer thermotolerans]AMX01467.1 acyl-CoA dehydrogenase [Microbulbifer thermotolerans]MCX2778310.1 acyl-CoA dehydrogenase C-terminal domain-containing protein [Microbulbifer thermotolerans]MCX2783275.1 acyl-CoA dehydrogenase C-terminal domain-containing protein [Microbulbifer thermotolerans]MCX2796128.1 acyl-CoA dehydrogenase C-terminal domain-containing protein [Microbulbifer thermotolerans]MCX2800357.1 acyl-CoA dehydrogen